MEEKFFSDRIKDKLEFSLKNNYLENILTEWIEEGDEKDRLDTYHILKNLDFFIDKINKKYNLKLSSTYIKSNLNKIIFDKLNNNIYSFNEHLTMKNIETRAWMITILCLSIINCNDIKKLIHYISQYFPKIFDDYTLFYIFDGITNNIDTSIKCYFDEIHSFIIKFKICNTILECQNNQIKKYQFSCMLWYIKYQQNDKFIDLEKNIKIYHQKIQQILNNNNNNYNYNDLFLKGDLLYSFGCSPVKVFIADIINLIEKIIKNENKKKLSRNDFIFILHLIRACVGIRFIYEELLHKQFEDICQLLFTFLKILRLYSDSIWNPVKLYLLRSFRKYYQVLENNIVIDNLYDELLNEDANIVTSACKTLQTFYQVKNSTNLILEAVNKQININGKNFSSDTIIALSNSLKLMSFKNNNVLEALEDRMYRDDSEEIREIARKLISEMGGNNAFKKLQLRQSIKDSYSTRIQRSQQDVENMFHTTLVDAKRGFNITLLMDVFIFLAGMFLIIFSGVMAIQSDFQNIEQWIGTGTSGGFGLLGILYFLFVGKPRKKISDNVNHLMFLKIIFLGYLRQLNLIDQSFNQHLLEEQILSIPITKSFYNSINNVMSNCLKLLRLNKQQVYEFINTNENINTLTENLEELKNNTKNITNQVIDNPVDSLMELGSYLNQDKNQDNEKDKNQDSKQDKNKDNKQDKNKDNKQDKNQKNKYPSWGSYFTYNNNSNENKTRYQIDEQSDIPKKSHQSTRHSLKYNKPNSRSPYTSNSDHYDYSDSFSNDSINTLTEVKVDKNIQDQKNLNSSTEKVTSSTIYKSPLKSSSSNKNLQKLNDKSNLEKLSKQVNEVIKYHKSNNQEDNNTSSTYTLQDIIIKAKNSDKCKNKNTTPAKII